MTPKSKPHKQATFKDFVAAAKRPAIVVNPDAFLDQNPSWRFGRLEMAPPYGWHELTAAELDSLRKRLIAFETMTWREIVLPATAGRSPHHQIPIEEIRCPSALARLEEVAPDAETLMSLRVTSKGRVWGIMAGPVCHLLFWDPEHLVYKMNLADN